MITSAQNASGPLLTISDLHVTIPQRRGEVTPLRGVNLSVESGRTLGIVGESGSGKTMTALAIMGLLPATGRISQGSIRFDGADLVSMSEKEARRRRGTDLGMVFQDPMTSLNPTMSIGDQIGEGLIVHQRMTRKDARVRAIEILQRVGMPRPDRIASDFPH